MLRLFDLLNNKEYATSIAGGASTLMHCEVGDRSSTSEAGWRELIKPFMEVKRGANYRSRTGASRLAMTGLILNASASRPSGAGSASV